MWWPWRRKGAHGAADGTPAQPARPAGSLYDSVRALAGGRATLEREAQASGDGYLRLVVPPPDPLSEWRTLKLDARTLDRVSPHDLMSYLLDLSPDVSKGQWDWSRMANAGWEARALVPGTQDVDGRAQAALDAYLGRIGALYGSVDVPVNRLFMNGLLRGALLSECVLDATGHQAVDLAVPDAGIVRFRQDSDPVRGTVYTAGQMQGYKWVPFDRPTVVYTPIDPVPGSPYGRPLLSPAVFAGLFMLSMLHDLRRVIAQQGMPRPDIVINLDKLAVPEGMLPGTEAYYAWLAQIGQQVANAYGVLEPDSAYVHTSATTLNRPVGAVDGDSLGGLGAVIEAVERQLVRALKTAPFMMGMSQSQTETMANRQWESYLQGIKSVQHLAEAQLGGQCETALRAEGIIAVVEWRFAENRASEEMRDEQVKQLKIANAREGYAAGHLSQDDAAQYAWGREAADVPEPRDTAVAAPSPGAQENPEPGASRDVPRTRLVSGGVPVRMVKDGPGTERSLDAVRAAKVVPLGADEPLPPLLALVGLSDDERAALSDTWDRSMVGGNGKYKGVLDAEIDGDDGDG